MRPTEKHVVYWLYDKAGRLLYVGCSVDSTTRYLAHYQKPWWPDVARKRERRYASRSEALRAEREAIQTENPIHNVVHRRTVAPDLMRDLSRSAAKVRTWTEKRNMLIRQLHDEGRHSLREIARHAGLNVGTVHTMLHGRKR